MFNAIPMNLKHAVSVGIGLFIGTIACGFLADRFGRRAIFTWSLLWYTAANVVMAFQDTAGGLNFWRFVVGLGLGVEMVTIGTYISELVPKQIRGRAFACEQAVGFVAVPVVAFLASTFRLWMPVFRRQCRTVFWLATRW